MEKMSHNKLVIKIVCVILAIILWLYVSYEENPSMSKTVKNVPVVILGEQALKESGFSVYSVSEKSVNVKVTGKRLSLGKINNRSLSANINVSSIKKSGEFVIPATITSTANATAGYYVKGNDIKVVVEPIISKTHLLSVHFSNDDSSYLIENYKSNYKSISISAPQSIAKEIASVTTEEISIENRDTVEYKDIPIVALGKDGQELNGVQFSPSKVDVTCSFYKTKTVPILIQGTDNQIYSINPSMSIYIYGSEDIIQKTKYILTQKVDIINHSPDSKIKIGLVLDKGIYTKDNKNYIEIEPKNLSLYIE